MLLSKMIKILQGIEAQHGGDLEVLYYANGGYDISTVDDITTGFNVYHKGREEELVVYVGDKDDE